jgi:hypothetical protein
MKRRSRTREGLLRATAKQQWAADKLERRKERRRGLGQAQDDRPGDAGRRGEQASSTLDSSDSILQVGIARI